MFKPNLLVVFNIVNKLKSRAAVCIAKALVKKLLAEFIPTVDCIRRFISCSECDCTIAVGTIIRRLRVALDLRVVGRLTLGDGVVSLATLCVVTFPVFGVFARGTACTGLLAQSVLVCNGFLGKSCLTIVGNGLRDRGHDERQYQAQNGGSAQNACQYMARRLITLLRFV